jgi:hypothetical protein
MYGKILHGASFGGLVNYINDPRKKATLVAYSDGVNVTNNQTITDSFVMQAGLSTRTKKPVGHFILSFSPHDTLRINDKMLEQIVNDYLNRMGYNDNQFVAFRHLDKEHPHVHIMVNRVNFKGKCTKDSHEKDKNIKVCKELTEQYGLYIAKGKETIKERRLCSMDAIRYQMLHHISESLQVARNWKEFEKELVKGGIRLRFRYNTHTNGIEGISFTLAKEHISDKMKHDISYSGKQLDSSLTLACICKKLGNPIAIVHEQARDMYDDARQEWYDSHNAYEVREIDRLFPDFDLQFPWQSKAKMYEAPQMGGNNQILEQDFFDGLYQTANDISDIGKGAIQVGLTSLEAILLPPYQPAISAGGGSSSSKLGWGDDDKYKKKYNNRSRGFGRGRH